MESNYSYGIERDEVQLKRNNEDHRKWSNPLEVRYVIQSYLYTYVIHEKFLTVYLTRLL